MNVYSVRYSLNRKKEYQIKTVIYEENGIISVTKEPFTKYGYNHICNIYNNYELLKNSTMNLAAPVLKGNVIAFPFIVGESLDEKLIKHVNEEDIKGFKDKIIWFKTMLEKDEQIDFIVTEPFERIFGTDYNLAGSRSLRVSNIDSNFDNLIINSNNEITVIDYEWVFDFPIPLDFILYRSISSFISKYQLPRTFLEAIQDLFVEMGMTKNLLISFDKMEQNFTSFIGHSTQMYSNYLKNISSYKNSNDIHIFEQEINGYLQLFWSSNEIFSEDLSTKINLITENQKQFIEIDLPESPINLLRIDPTTFVSDIDINGSVIIGEKELNIFDLVISTIDCIIIENKATKKGKVISSSSDPQILLKHTLLNNIIQKKLKIELSYSKSIEKNLNIAINVKNNEMKNLINKNELLEDEIRSLVQKEEKLSVKTVNLSQEINILKEKVEESNKIIQEKVETIEKIVTSKVWKILKRMKLVKI
ncbi:hypothetical protein [Lysinibacillus fusiformis]|uniref:hypothetical protein n=1 Tax=Lysinibacillus fusiformis TaxID=28031 RepID=UPI003D00F486